MLRARPGRQRGEGGGMENSPAGALARHIQFSFVGPLTYLSLPLSFLRYPLASPSTTHLLQLVSLRDPIIGCAARREPG